MRAPADAPARLQQNRAQYTRAVRVVESYARRGDLERVLRGAVVAGNVGWRAPTGFLNDRELEQLVVQTARAGGEAPRVDGERSAGRVLHVLSEGYEIGGHTRLAWRWMERDPRRSDVVLTNQQGRAPAGLLRAAASAGGCVTDLRSSGLSLSARVAALRAQMDLADIVVMHVHSWDSVALAAANLPGPRPPIIFENHADHAFWLGLGCADVVMDHRSAAQQLSAELRGVRADRLGLLPLPIEEIRPAAERDSLRAALGLRPRDVAAVSVASPFKMSPLWGRGFEPLLLRALSAQPRLKIFLVGPPDEGPWARLSARYQGRLMVLGPRADLDAILPAMDLYLDSYPVSSGTSILEAAAAGLPPLSLQEHAGHRRIFHANSPGLDGTGHATATDDEYFRQLDALVTDDTLRATRGAAAKESVLGTHAGAGWDTYLEELYARARTVPAADLDEYPAAGQNPSYGAYLVGYMQGSGSAMDAAAYAGPLGPLFDEQLRCDLFVSSARSLGRSLSVRVRSGWESERAWTVRLLELAKRHPRLSVSLPVVAGDGPDARATVGRLSELLAEIGQDTQTCGDITVSATDPVLSKPSVTDPIDLVPETLDWLETLISSPCWEARAARDTVVPAGAR